MFLIMDDVILVTEKLHKNPVPNKLIKELNFGVVEKTS